MGIETDKMKCKLKVSNGKNICETHNVCYPTLNQLMLHVYFEDRR